MKKIVFIAMLCLVIIGSFAASAGKTTEISNTKSKIVSAGHITATKAKVSAVKFVIGDRTYTSSCGTWIVTGANYGAVQEQANCNQACANGWTTWAWNGTTLSER